MLKYSKNQATRNLDSINCPTKANSDDTEGINNSVNHIALKEVSNQVLNCYQLNFQLNFKSYSKLSYLDLSV